MTLIFDHILKHEKRYFFFRTGLTGTKVHHNLATNVSKFDLEPRKNTKQYESMHYKGPPIVSFQNIFRSMPRKIHNGTKMTYGIFFKLKIFNFDFRRFDFIITIKNGEKLEFFLRNS